MPSAPTTLRKFRPGSASSAKLLPAVPTRGLSLPARLQGNLEMKFYQSGHMIYANEPSLRTLHDNVAAMVRRTSGPRAK